MYITNDIKYVGVNDHQVDLFEGQYKVPNGMAYNSYVIMDEKIAVMDTVDVNFGSEWLLNIEKELGGRQPDYLIVQHMEPDHSACIADFMLYYKNAQIVSSEKAFAMMKNFFGTDFEGRKVVVQSGSTLRLGAHTLAFVEAPMVHWPEVIVSYDVLEKVLFSADGVGKFGANDVQEDWADEARRYYIGIVGMYGKFVQDLLKIAGTLDIEIICPTHGPVIKENLGYYLDLYDKWSSYTPEEEGIVVAYTSVYGHTKEAALEVAEMLRACKAPNVVVYDLARDDMSAAVSDAFRYSKLVLATTTYNGEIYPFMNDYLNRLVEHKFQKRTVALIENGSWAPQAGRLMKEKLMRCDNIEFTANNVHIKSALNEKNYQEMEKMVYELCQEYIEHDDELANKNNMAALFKIGYGLYVVTAREENKDNGCIANSITQITNSPNRIAVTLNKGNYTHDMIMRTGKMNVNCLSVEAPFDVFTNFGFQSGRDVDKFASWPLLRSGNGIAYLPKYINSFMSLEVEACHDFDTHTMFICSVSEARVISGKETMTYNYYQANVKPKPQPTEKKGFVCQICGYIYEGDELPADFICPICKHPASDFKPL